MLSISVSNTQDMCVCGGQSNHLNIHYASQFSDILIRCEGSINIPA